MPENEFRERFGEYQSLQSKADVVSALCSCFRVSSTAVIVLDAYEYHCHYGTNHSRSGI